jgi:ABC-type amino acid transport substrate-binding protein
LFRKNNYPVVEKGSIQDIFQRLKRGECDYVTFGANEVLSVYETLAKPQGGLVIAPGVKLYYPFALIFYINPKQEKLVDRITKGLKIFQSLGQFNDFFDMHYRFVVEQLSLSSRSTITLENPALPAQLSGIVTQTLIDR